MKTVLLLAWLGLLLLPARAEDWTTTNGTIYHNVQVLSHDSAYVTILHQDGGGRIPLSTLGPDVQKRFDYDPSKAALQIAATAAADQRDRAALAQEKAKGDAQEAQRQKEAADALTLALFSPPPDADIPANNTPNSPPPDASDAPAIASEPPTEIDDWGYGDFGYGYGYGYGYGGFGHRGYRGGGWNTAHVTHASSHGTGVAGRSPEAQRH